MTAPSYIHTRRCRHTSRLPRSSHIHDHQGAYARAYATIHSIFIVKPCRCSAPLSASQLQSTCNNRNTVKTTTNNNRTQVHCECHQNNTRTDPNNRELRMEKNLHLPTKFWTAQKFIFPCLFQVARRALEVPEHQSNLSRPGLRRDKFLRKVESTWHSQY